jgi:deoxyinosine 3'endonuclease (endonuclease V)
MTDDIKTHWIIEQNRLKQQLIISNTIDLTSVKYIGGVDLSFIKGNDIDACAALVILSYPELKVVYENYKMVQLTQPYIPGFLAFREVDHIINLYDELKNTQPMLLPQIIFVDGNGILHPEGFGFACHLGVMLDVPTIGVGKKLFLVDGLDKKIVRDKFNDTCKQSGDYMYITGNSGKVWGAAYKSNDNMINPVYVSVGHKISIEMCLEILKKVCPFRVPEPIRIADIGSREYLRKLSQKFKL